jgi:hypothetical protein
MGIVRHASSRYREFLRDFSHRSSKERKTAAAEKRRLRLPTRIAVIFVVGGLGVLLAWAAFSTLYGR